MPYHLFRGRIPRESLEKRDTMAGKGTRDRALNTIMKALLMVGPPFKNGRPETNQTLNGLENAGLRDRGFGKPSLAGYSRPVQSGRSSGRGSDGSDLMRSQLG